MKTYQRMIVGIAIMGSAIGGAIGDHTIMSGRLERAESRLEETIKQEQEHRESESARHQAFLSQLPNYTNYEVWSGDGMGSSWYDEAKGLADLEAHYRK